MTAKIKKITMTAVVFAIMLVCVVCRDMPVQAASVPLEHFSAKYTLDNGFTYTVNWWNNADEQYKTFGITLPHQMEGKEVEIDFDSWGDAALDGQKLTHNQKIVLAAGEHTLTFGGFEYNLAVFYTSEIPTVYITTESGDMQAVYDDKGHKEPGYITIVNGNDFEYDGELDQIKGRGNSTWLLPKKPFNIKLADKTDLFGMGKSKSFSLLADYQDPTLIKNKLAIDFADAMGINFASKSQSVDLFIDGDYIGKYTLIERVEVDDNRVEIANLEDLNEEANPDIDIEECAVAGDTSKESGFNPGGYRYVEIPNNPQDITGGYLLEFELGDRYKNEVSGFVTEYGQPVVIKSPEFASKEQVEYIRGYYQEFEDAILSDDGYNSLGVHYSEYIDLQSFAKMYVFNEYVKNLDCGISSFYMYKDAGGKLVAGPVWDYDASLGTKQMRFDHDMADAKALWATDNRLVDEELKDKKTLYSIMCRHADFRAEANVQWEEVFAPYMETLFANADSLAEEIKNSAVADKYKWAENQSQLSAQQVADDYTANVAELKTFMTDRYGFLDGFFTSEARYIQYCANGGDGIMTEPYAYFKGEKATAKDNAFVNGEKTFHGWCTKPDGRGKIYNSGEEITVKNNNITLYALWEKPGAMDRIAGFFSTIFE